MQKIYDYIFELSPKKLAIYLVLGPLLLFLLHTIFTIGIRNLSNNSPTQENLIRIIIIILALCLAIFVLLWLCWLRSVVYSVGDMQLGLPRKWFEIAYVALWIYIIYTVTVSIIEPLMDTHFSGADYRYLIYASKEFMSFGGIMIAYPIVCHYAARAVTAKRNNSPATFVQAIPLTLLLIFGTVLGIPFLHPHFSSRSSKNSRILTVYAIAFGLLVFIVIIGFVAAVTGLL
ncbi:hypothetical protein FGM00_00430 [Aggregatimonas sangjinii]|uniref:Uncharacterized protein n=1 Tax=Aggregatimonas sangjinii TaxID=2583587 RepID=A0A5B7SNS0_9FLAO|nr:hypothetical protein [Aggregatimonas sangjinii]QCW98660.1 hypothetical protein FGM00_00430 [Aggregatimonas sangjinii]